MKSVSASEEVETTHIETVISQTLPDTRDHVEGAEDVFRVVVHVCLGQ